MIKFDGYVANGIKSVSVDSDLVLRAMLGAARINEAPFIGKDTLKEMKGYSLSSALETLARDYGQKVADCEAPYTVKAFGKTVFEVEADRYYIPVICSLDEFHHFKPHHDRIVVLTRDGSGSDADLREAMEGEYERIYSNDAGDIAYAYIRHAYKGRAIAECMEVFAYGLPYRMKELELPASHPVELSDWQVFEELKTGNRIAAMVKPGDVNAAFLNVTELPYMRGKHPEHGHVLIVGASRHGNAEAAILTYAKACGVELEKPTEPTVWDEIPF